ncbi:MAG TPA: UDP-glucose 4-epimerase, partial [Chloroflexi bacterium]|nr:UDP-glucose 4-epimerase [Chloroflexota bacterium]
MKVIVTGAAGFIGSHLSERLLADGHEVVGIDCFTDYYRRARKEQNLEAARSHRNFSFEELDLVDADLTAALEGADVVYHLAGQPGVRPSWGHQFDRYTRDNIIATQRLLEHLKGSHLKRLVFAGSSSVYGDAEAFPTRESALPRPVSPYGVTKLAAEHLAHLYTRNFDIPAVSVRYFTVYGPRQRPDMAFSRFMQALADGDPIEVFGDGEQTREFTYVSDAVEGTIKA